MAETATSAAEGRPRPAATLVLARTAPSGIEVLVLRRSRKSRFAPGFVVFPGGVVEAGDSVLAERWFGDPNDLGRACAIRELGEEAALAVTASGVRELDRGADVVDVVSADPPSAEAVPQVGRWVGPEVVERRFDAGFFVAVAGDEIAPHPDGVEIEDAWWARPGDVLDGHPLWRSLMWPTYRMLERLAETASVEDVLRLRLPQEAPGEEHIRLWPGNPPPGYPRLRVDLDDGGRGGGS